MKQLFWAISICTLITTGCDSNSNDKDPKTTEAKKAEVDYAASLTDISASKDLKTLLAQNWESKEDAQEAALSGGSAAFDMPYRGFSFFADGTVVQNPRDNIRLGKWDVDAAGKTITITYTGGAKAQYTIEKAEAKTLILTSVADKKKIEYGSDGKIEKVMADDPFYGSNNQWRIKPTASETDEAIKKRLQNCVDFYNKLLKDKIARNTTSPGIFTGLPPVFNWYDGSITVTGKEKLMDKWVNCFYNKAQAFKAQEMLENIISKKYKWDKSVSNWLAKDAVVFQQIRDTLAAAK